MGEQLTDLLRDRLAGHEMDVPAGAWEHISGQLAAEAGGEALRESLQAKFQGHEVPVDPSAWAHIGGQLGHAGATGSSLAAGWMAAGAAAVLVSAGLLIWSNRPAPVDAPQPAAPVVELVQPKPANAQAKPAETPAAPVEVATTPAAKPATASKKAPATTAPAPNPAPAPAENEPAAPQPLHNQGSAVAATAQAQPQPRTEAETEPEAKPAALTPPAPVPAEATHTGAANTKAPETDKAEAEPQPEPRTEPAAQPAANPFAPEAANGIFIPNVFSPQGDGVNDKLEIVAPGYEQAEVRVFSAKTGEPVFYTNNLANRWDGRLPNGNVADEGYYRCMVQLTDLEGHVRVKTEVVRLYR